MSVVAINRSKATASYGMNHICSVNPTVMRDVANSKIKISIDTLLMTTPVGDQAVVLAWILIECMAKAGIPKPEHFPRRAKSTN